VPDLRSYTLTPALLAAHAGEQMLFLAADAHLLGRTYPLSTERPAGYSLHVRGEAEPRHVRLGRGRPTSSAARVTIDASGLSVTMAEAPEPAPDSDRPGGVALVSTVTSVAVVSVLGPIMQRSTAPGPCSDFVMGYDSIAESYCAAHASSADSVAMIFDSPGGMAAGMFAGIGVMRAAKAASGKPVIGHIGALCASAAYALASTLCDVLVISPGGYAGSIGCRAGAYNRSDALAKAGVSFTGWGWPPPPEGESASGKLALHPDMPPTKLGNERGTRDVNDEGRAFGEMVAAVRGGAGLDMAAILALHADMLRGEAAISAGLADMLGEEADAMALAMAKAVERRADVVAARPPPPDDDENEDDRDDEDDRESAAPLAQPTGDHPMKLAAFAKLVGLEAEAAEPAILAALTPIAGLAKATLKAAGTTDPEDAKAWVKRAGQALDAEPARVKALADAQATAEMAERLRLGDELVAKGHKPGDVFLYTVEGETETSPGRKVRTGLVPEYAAPSRDKSGDEIGMTLGTLRGFVKRAPTLARESGTARQATDSPFEPVARKGGAFSAADPAVIALAAKSGVTPEIMAASMGQMETAFSEGAAR
jgi:ClpP class serine protease